jgi:hypothetical protein
MQYLMMIWVDEKGWDTATPEQQQKQMAAYTAFREAIVKAGVLKGSNRLQRSTTGTMIRTVDGKTQVLDGPYADTKEQVGGYFLIDVPDLDAAISWASRCPGAQHGTIELRPVWETPTTPKH